MDTSTPVTILGPDEPDPIGIGESADRNPEPIRTPQHANGKVGIPTIDPFDIRTTSSGANGGSGSPTPITTGKRRGRPPGSTNRPKDEKAPVSNNLEKVSIEDLLISCHEMLAVFCHADELELDAEEAKQGAHHIKEISKLYNHTFNPATLVWMSFVMWILAVYGTRGVAIYKRVTEPKEAGPTLVKTPPKPASDTAGAKSPAKENKVTNPSQLWSEAPITQYD